MSEPNKTHVTWSIEAPNGKCPYCGDDVVLVVCDGWQTDRESAIETVGQERYEADFEDFVIDPTDEVTGHYCGICNRLVSLSLNTQ